MVAPVVGLNTRMDQMSQDMHTVQQAIGDLTGLISKIQAQLTDLSNAVKVMSAPAPPPPGIRQPGSAVAGAPGRCRRRRAARRRPDDLRDRPLQQCQSRPHTAASSIWRCRSSRDYLRWYGNTELAPNAQYYIAWIHASQGDLRPTPIREYDMVLEKYPDNNKTPDAHVRQGCGARPGWAAAPMAPTSSRS